MKRRTIFAAGAAWLLLAVPAAAQSPQPSVGTIQQRLGYPANSRLLIIHADDFGMSHSVNSAIIEALEHGWVTSASMMVPCPWFAEAARWARAHAEADLGIHLVLNSEWTTLRWGPISGRDKVESLLDAQGYLPLLESDVARNAKPAEVARELRTQIDFAHASGVNITHLDSHMGALFQTERLFHIYRQLGKSYSLPELLERQGDRGGAEAPAWAAEARKAALIDRVLQIMPGVAADHWFDAYKQMLTPLAPGVYQLIVHLAHDNDEMQAVTAGHPDWGAAWRQHDFDLVRSEAFRNFLKQQGFHLITWRELTKAQLTTAVR